MAGIGPAIFSGLLSGLSGLPQGMQAATNEDLARQRLGMEQQQIDLQKQAMQGVEVPQGTVPGGWGAPGPTGGTMLKPQVLPFLQHFMGQQQSQQDRANATASLRRIAEQTGNQNFAHLADLMEGGAIKDAGSLYETEVKGQQAIDEANRSASLVNSLMSGQPISLDTLPARGAARVPAAPTLTGGGMPSAQATDLANAQRGAAVSGPDFTAPTGAGAGGPATPMPAAPSAYRPTIALKAGPATITLATPSDEVDHVSSSMFNGRLYHQLSQPEQQAVLKQIQQNKLNYANAQGQAQLALEQNKPLTPDQAAAIGVPYGTTQGQAGKLGIVPQNPTERTKVEGLRTFAEMANSIADDLERVLPDTKARASFAARQLVQGLPAAKVFATLTPEEQALASRLGSLTFHWEQSMGGTRLAANVQAQKRVQQIIGQPESAMAPASLRALANDAAIELRSMGQAQQRPARPGMPSAPSPSAPTAPAAPVQAQKPLPQRYKELRDSGMSKEQAGQQLKKEGYVLP